MITLDPKFEDLFLVTLVMNFLDLPDEETKKILENPVKTALEIMPFLKEIDKTLAKEIIVIIYDTKINNNMERFLTFIKKPESKISKARIMGLIQNFIKTIEILEKHFEFSLLKIRSPKEIEKIKASFVLFPVLKEIKVPMFSPNKIREIEAEIKEKERKNKIDWEKIEEKIKNKKLPTNEVTPDEINNETLTPLFINNGEVYTEEEMKKINQQPVKTKEQPPEEPYEEVIVPEIPCFPTFDGIEQVPAVVIRLENETIVPCYLIKNLTDDINKIDQFISSTLITPEEKLLFVEKTKISYLFYNNI